MRQKQDKILWGRLFRRSFALFLATLGVWALLMGLGSGMASKAFLSLGQNSGFVAAALRAEFGDVVEETGPLAGMDGWQRLVLGESVYLRGGLSAVGTLPTGDEGMDLAGTDPAVNLPAGQPAEDHDDLTEEPQTTTAPGGIIERTLIPTSPDGYEVSGGVYLYNRTKLPVDLSTLTANPVELSLPSGEPQILIMHTHGTEAYTQDGTDIYTPSDNNTRTLDTNYNMVRVGEEMARVFTEMGLSVVHDRTLYDYPAYNGAYGRSGEGVKQYLAQYPSIRVVLDVHRDALIGSDGTVYKAVTTVDGVKTAQAMLVLGSSEGGGHPNWQKNLNLAAKLQQGLNTLYPTLARPMTLRSSVYNQSLTPGSLLVEMGTHGNTLQEALNGARLFARSAGQVLLGLKE